MECLPTKRETSPSLFFLSLSHTAWKNLFSFRARGNIILELRVLLNEYFLDDNYPYEGHQVTRDRILAFEGSGMEFVGVGTEAAFPAGWCPGIWGCLRHSGFQDIPGLTLTNLRLWLGKLRGKVNWMGWRYQ